MSKFVATPENTAVQPPELIEELKLKWAEQQTKLRTRVIEVDQHEWVIAHGEITDDKNDFGASSTHTDVEVNTSNANGTRSTEHDEQAEHTATQSNSDNINSDNSNSRSKSKALTIVAGTDISFVKDTNEACVCVTFLSFPGLRVLHTAYEHVTMNLPYISGFLAFREVDPIVDLFRRAAKESELSADVLMVDGNGVWHPRELGLASHLGVLLDIPTVGIGKTCLNVDGLDSRAVRASIKTPEHDQIVHDCGFASVPVVGQSGRVWGAVVRPTKTTANPVYVSVGHRISLETAIELVRATSLFRVPEPVRQADLLSREMLRKEAE